jgi:hypothetical protein
MGYVGLLPRAMKLKGVWTRLLKLLSARRKPPPSEETMMGTATVESSTVTEMMGAFE